MRWMKRIRNQSNAGDVAHPTTSARAPDEKKEETRAAAPDGGYGWLIVLASFVSHCLIDGVTYAFGVYTPDLVEYYGVSRQTVGWVNSILVGVTFASGPLTSKLCDMFGFRAVTIIGGLLSTIGFAVVFFHSNFVSFILMTSVLGGFGFGLAYLPSICIVSEYFNRKRALAIGLAVCGSGIGTFLFGPLIGYLRNCYSWRGSMLIVSGLLLNSCVCGVLYRPLPESLEALATSSSDHGLHHGLNKMDTHLNAENSQNNATRIQTQPITPAVLQRHRFPICLYGRLVASWTCVHQETRHDNQHNAFTKRSRCHSLGGIINPYLLKNCSFLSFAVSNLLTSLGFNAPFLFAVDKAVTMGVPPLEASFLIASLGIGNTLGRVIFGALATRGNPRFRLHLYNASLVLAGLTTMTSFLATTYYRMVAYTVGFGFCSGSYVTLTPVILVDLVGIDSLADAFGLTMLFMGVAVFAGPPMAGWIYDASGSYDLAFAVCGALIFASGAMMYPLTCGTWKKPIKQSRS